MKKILAFLMAVLIVVGIFPITAMADGEVAQIGEAKYATLENAVASAAAGQTVTLLKNVTITSQLNIDKAIILDGDGNKIDGSAIHNNGAILVDGVAATIKNLEVIGPNSQTANEGADGRRWDSGEFGIKLYKATGAELDTVTVTGANAGIQVNGGSVTMKNNITVSGNEFGGIELCHSGELDLSAAMLVNDGETDAKPVLWNDDNKGTITFSTSQPLSKKIIANEDKDHYYLSGTAQASLNGQKYLTLADAIKDADDGDTVTLLKDVILDNTLEIRGRNIVLNMNNHKVQRNGAKVFDIANSNFHITGTGTIYENCSYKSSLAPIVARGSATKDVANYTVITIDSDVTLKGTYAGIFIAKGDNEASYKHYGLVINMNGTFAPIDTYSTLDYGIYVNGSVNTTNGNVPIIKLNGAKAIDTNSLFYAAGYAKWELTDVEANCLETALSIKAGEFVINSGNYSAAGQYANPGSDSSNGDVSTGAALSITSNDGYAHKIDVTVNGGTFTSQNGHAIFEGIPNGEKDPHNPVATKSYATLAVKGGAFVGAANKDAVNVKTAENKKFITGGTFSSDPKAYLAEGYFSKAIGTGKWQVKPMEVVVKPAVVDEQNNITVGGENVEVKGTGEGEGKPSAQEAATAITKTLATEAVYAFEGTGIDKATNGLKIADLGVAEGTIEDKQVNVKLEAVDVEKSGDNTIITRMEFDVKPVAVLGDGTEKVIPNNKIKAPITFRLPIDKNITDKTVAVYHRENEDADFKLVGTYEIKTDANGEKYIEIEASKFSLYSYKVLTEANAIAKVGDKLYASLAEAVDEVRNGETITVLRDNHETVTVNREVRFYLVGADGVNELGNVKAGDHYRRYIDGNKYAFKRYKPGDTVVIGGNKDKEKKPEERKEENPETGAPVMSMGALVVLAAAYVATRKH